jgi:aspartate racemase
MKTIGLIGGMSWESTLEYYRIINEMVKEKLGGLNSAKILMYSVNFAEIAELQHKDEWSELSQILTDIAVKLENGGAEAVLICTNTMHKVADEVQKGINVPLINIIDVTAERIKNKGLKRVGLLGTKFTMEDEFYRKRLEKYGIQVLIPDEEGREVVHSVIYNELCVGVIKPESKEAYLKIIQDLSSKGAEGVVLGCTEIPLLIKQEDCDIPIFDTTRIHAEAAVKFALNES